MTKKKHEDAMKIVKLVADQRGITREELEALADEISGQAGKGYPARVLKEMGKKGVQACKAGKDLAKSIKKLQKQ